MSKNNKTGSVYSSLETLDQSKTVNIKNETKGELVIYKLIKDEPESALIIQNGDYAEIDSSLLNTNSNLKRCLANKLIKVLTDEEVQALNLEKEKERKRRERVENRKKGLSGLSIEESIAKIKMVSNIERLETMADMETRQEVIDAIDDRIDELEDLNFK